MTEPKHSLFAGIKGEIGSFAAELREMLELRWELARMEIRADARSVRRLAVAGLIVAIMILSAVPILVVAVAELLSAWLGIRCFVWLLIFGFGLLIIAGTGGYWAWRRFRRRLVAMQQTREELREDVVWLREWVGQGQDEGR